MPRYDYKCATCGHVYEKREGFDAPPVQPCPDCTGVARRVLTPPAIVFKGSGWYATDSRKSQTGSDRSSNGSDSDSSSSDSKPAAAETKSDSGSKSESGGKSDSGSKSEAPSKSATSPSTAAAD